VSLGNEPLRVGVVGCGNISDAYLTRAAEFDALTVVACADVDPARTAAQAARYGVRPMTPDALLADEAVDLVINLTPPLAHASISLAALAAGKHLYSEKPIGVTLEEGRRVVAAGEAAGRRVGSAPDTFLGGGHQLARRMVDEGVIGRPIAGTIWFASHGMEHWHPDPRAFYTRGGGPVLDIGAYYVSAMVNLIGPVRRVTALAGRGFAERLVTTEGSALRGSTVKVEVDTHVAGALEFASGAVVGFVKSWDLYAEAHYRLELYGTTGTMLLPDPNFFGGEIRLSRAGAPFEGIDASAEPYAAPNRRTTRGADVADYRIIGVVDMALAIREGRPHRCSGAFALHALEVLEAMATSARTGRHVEIASTCERPAAMAGPFA
jgi:predicted dehydrogenase